MPLPVVVLRRFYRFLSEFSSPALPRDGGLQRGWKHRKHLLIAAGAELHVDADP